MKEVGRLQINEVVENIAIGTRGRGFTSRASQIGYCRQRLTTAATFLYRLWRYDAKMGPNARYTFRRNTASTTKI